MASANPWEQLSKGIDLPFNPAITVPEPSVPAAAASPTEPT
jgi:hypothetical protein